MFTYAPPSNGTAGYAIVTDRFMGIVSADAAPEVISELHRVLNMPGATIEDGLSIASQAGAAERFALVELLRETERSVLLAVQGDVVVDLDGTESSRFTWSNGPAWVTGEVTGVASLRLSLSHQPADARVLPLSNGAVEASAVAIAPPASLRAAPLASPPVDTVATPEPEPATAATPSLPEPPALPPGETPRATSPRGATPGLSHSRQPRRIDLAQLMSTKTWTLRLPDGNEVEAAPQIVVGRRPWRTSEDETSSYYIVVPSPHREVSGKHVEFTMVDGVLHAHDLDSTNGTLVITPNKPPRLLHSGDAVSLAEGDALDLGEGFRIVVGTRQ